MRSVRTVPVVLLPWLVLNPGEAHASDRPSGLYALGGIDSGIPTEALDQPFVDGYAMRTLWSTVEPAPGDVQLGAIDEAIAALQPAGQHLTLVVFPTAVPQHVLDSVAPEETYLRLGDEGEEVLSVVPWSATALSAWQTVVEALAAHPVWDEARQSMVPLAEHPTLRQINAPVVGLGGIRDPGGRLVAHPDYERARFVDAVVDSTHVVVDRFPSAFPYLAFFGMNDDEMGLRDDLLEALGAEFDWSTEAPRLGLFQENLSCDGPVPTNNVLAQEQDATFTMFQMLQAWIQPFARAEQTDPCLVTTVEGDRQSAVSGPEVGVEFGWTEFGAHYFELYVADLAHGPFADELATWDAALDGTDAIVLPPPTPGLAGEVNSLRALDATPGATVTFVASTDAGGSPVPGCPALTVELAGPSVLAEATADPDGRAEITLSVPPGLAGETVRFQAVDRDRCERSPVATKAFP